MTPAAVAKLVMTLFRLSVIGTVPAPSNAKPSEPRMIDIRVQPEGFGGASPADMNAVLRDRAQASRIFQRTRVHHE